MAEKIANRAQDFNKWYTDVVQTADLADYAPVKGCMVIKPYGYALWENMQHALDTAIKATGAQNAYFPLFIPESFLKREAQHVEGFSPELAVVTHAGGKKLEEPLIVRPTSETIINEMFSKWVRSYRDLPMMINQWANVVRWELRTRLFLRTTEFLWQEGHTCHTTNEEAEREALQMLEVYRTFAEDYLAIPCVTGTKSDAEKFAGANTTYTIEGMMGDRKALQMGTSHNLGQNFAKVFNTQFLDNTGQQQFVWQTSWGVSTRLVGATVLVHGDDKGLRLPPRIAPIQAVIVPIGKTDEEKAAVAKVSARVARDLTAAGIRVKLDDREQFTPGFKYNEWELKGVPLRLEIGPRDVADNATMAVRRDQPGKSKLSLDGLAVQVAVLLEEVQSGLLAQAQQLRDDNTRDAASLDELAEIIKTNRGFVRVWWNGDSDAEARLKERTKATLRCYPLVQPGGEGKCVATGAMTNQQALFAVAY
ncbi:MAG TPA: proline--tRNA ligase [Armatimonadota bacterium]